MPPQKQTRKKEWPHPEIQTRPGPQSGTSTQVDSGSKTGSASHPSNGTRNPADSAQKSVSGNKTGSHGKTPYITFVHTPSAKADAPFIPRSYSELLSKLDPSLLEKIIRSTVPSQSLQPSLSAPSPSHGLIDAFIDWITNTANLKSVLSRLSPEDNSILSLGVLANGRLSPHDIPDRKKESLANLVRSGLLFPLEADGPPSYTVPLEVCLGFHFPYYSKYPPSLLLFLNRISQDFTRRILILTPLKPATQRKILLGTAFYTHVTSDFEKRFSSFSSNPRAILRILIENGNRMPYATFNDMDPDRKSSSHRYWGWGDPLEQFFSRYYNHRQNDLTPFKKNTASLIASGFLITLPNESDSSYDIAVPEEARPVVNRTVSRERKARCRELEKELPAPPPAKYYSYTGRVPDDLLKLQAASLCGMPGLNKDGSYSQKSIKTLGNMLEARESHLMTNLFIVRPPETEGIRRKSPKPDPDPVRIIREAVQGSPAIWSLLATLGSLRGWADRDVFIQILKTNLDFLSQFERRNFGDTISSLLNAFFFHGLVDYSTDIKLLHPTTLLAQVLSGSPTPDSSWVTKSRKPLLVQPGLEILTPLRTHPRLLKDLASFTDLTTLDQMIGFRLSRKSLQRGFDGGKTVDSITRLLTTASKHPLPQSVLRFLQSCGEKRGEAVVHPCFSVVECTGLGTREKILSLKGVDASALDDGSPLLLVRFPPPAQFLALLKKNGLFAELSTSKAPPPPKGATADHKKLIALQQTGKKAKIHYRKGYNWVSTRQVTIHCVKNNLVYFYDRQGIIQSLPLSKVVEVTEI